MKCNTIFILGAGFTRAVFKDAPLNSELLGALIKTQNAANIQAVAKRIQCKYRTRPTDIELFLTLFDLEMYSESDEALKKKMNEEREGINREIAQFFELFRFTQQCIAHNPWLQRFAEEVLRPNDAIITLNYDCLVEGVLDFFDAWRPRSGYGTMVHPLVAEDRSDINPKGIIIYKIHGSEHFVLSEIHGTLSQRAIGFPINSSIYPKSGRHRDLGPHTSDRSRVSIIAPSFVKIPNLDLQVVMLRVLELAITAKRLIVMGCSFRKEDTFLRMLLTQLILHKGESRKQVIIVDPYAEEIKERLREYWEGNLSDRVEFRAICGNVEVSIQTLSDFMMG